MSNGIDIFENYRIDQELEEASKVPQFKWSQANRGAYRAAKEQFYKDFDQMGEKIAFILKDAPMNEDKTRYVQGSDQLELAKKYIRDFNQAFYSVNDEFSKNIEKDMGFKLKSANMFDLFSTTMVDIVDHGGYDPRELEAAMSGNAKVSEAINEQTKSEITLLGKQLEAYQEAVSDAVELYGQDSDQYIKAKAGYDAVLPKYEKASGLKFDLTWGKDTESSIIGKPKAIEEKSNFDIVQDAIGITDKNIQDFTKVVGTGAALTGLAYGDKIPEAAKTAKDAVVNASKYVKNVTNLSNAHINKFLSSDDVMKAVEYVSSQQSKLDQMEAKGFDASKTATQRKNLQKSIDNSTKKIVQKYAKEFKVNEDVIESLFKKGTIKKWNLWKFKSGLNKVGTGRMAKGFHSYAIGGMINDALGVEREGLTGVAVDVGLGKTVEWTVINKAKQLLNTRQGRAYLKKRLGNQGMKILSQRIVPTAGWASIGLALYGLAEAGYDMYNAIYGAPEELVDDSKIPAPPKDKIVE